MGRNREFMDLGMALGDLNYRDRDEVLGLQVEVTPTQIAVALNEIRELAQEGYANGASPGVITDSLYK